MKQFSTILLTLTVCFSVFSQEKTEAKAKERIGFGIYFSPEVNSLIIQNHASYFTHLAVHPKFGVSIGAEMNFTFWEYLVLKAGFGFGLKRVGSTENYVYQKYFHLEHGLINTPVTVVNEEMLQEAQFPISLHYKFSKRFFIGAGIEFVLPNRFNSNSYLYVDDYPEIEPQKAYYGLVGTERNIAFSMSAGYRFNFTQSSYLLLEPIFRIYTNKNRIAQDAYSRFYSVGLKTTFWLGGR